MNNNKNHKTIMDSEYFCILHINQTKSFDAKRISQTITFRWLKHQTEKTICSQFNCLGSFSHI